ncbi:hypothetical protein V8D89_005540 [Ganoderma adspersum]
MPKQEDPSPQREKLTVTIPHRRKSTRLTALRRATTLHPSEKSTASSRPGLRSAGMQKKTKSTTALGVAREHYARETYWKRAAFTQLHGRIRCLFCAPHPPVTLKARGTMNRLPDAAVRHLRESCAHFEGSGMYRRYRDGGRCGGGRRGKLSKKEIVAEVVRDDEKVAVAEVFCRRDRAHRKRCAELGLSPEDVEEKLGRHALLCKAEECECCPHPSFSECLEGVNNEEVEEEEEEEEAPKERKKKKRKLKDTVPGQLVRIKQEEEDLDIQDILQTSWRSAASEAENEEAQEGSLKRKVPEDDEGLEEEAEVDILLKQIRFRDDTTAPIR